ncbi:OmpP1/FadL family transporter [Thiothrix winogradskyi]|uniref:Outer membrane protein transport protein n=1 Tax=Thiothrix winogradskyi TaxID=96472 RepID=A0ABY3T1R3_9GAMM|nr:outer membrane protein transport protein [Thiothrix winogradskyi]UJS25741.1 outer membrane protein transport protein [Thiothrix winogradskyi]
MWHLSKFALAIAATCVCSSAAHAAGFALANQSASGTGNAFAGGAAAAEDASTAWSNPAAMLELGSGKHVSVSAHLVVPEAKFTNGASGPMTGIDDDGGNNGVVPGLYGARSINDKLSVGVSVNAPFGLGTEYADNWIGRYHATESTIKTLNVNPSVAYKINDQWSVGAGVSAQKFDVELKRMTPIPGLPGDHKVTIAGDATSFGVNAGVLFKPSTNTRVGLSHRSGIDHDLEGTVSAPIPAAHPAAAALNTAVTAEASLPASTSLSVVQKVNDKLEVMGDVTRTGWSSFERLKVVRSANGSVVTDDYQGWEDSDRYALGANYQYNDRLKLRVGVARDNTPIPNAQLRTPRTPDNDRTWVAVGGNYELAKGLDVDVGYVHISTKDTPIDNRNAAGLLLNGNYDNKMDVVGAQLNWSF